MSLKSFHLVFILLVIVGADMFGAWSVWYYAQQGGCRRAGAGDPRRPRRLRVDLVRDQAGASDGYRAHRLMELPLAQGRKPTVGGTQMGSGRSRAISIEGASSDQ